MISFLVTALLACTDYSPCSRRLSDLLLLCTCHIHLPYLLPLISLFTALFTESSRLEVIPGGLMHSKTAPQARDTRTFTHSSPKAAPDDRNGRLRCV
jgi:hypothetical protein